MAECSTSLTSFSPSHISLFAGVGGIDLAAHWAGFRTTAFVENNRYCQQVLAARFPGRPIYGDIREFNATEYRGTTSLISGGFPCQDISNAGAGNTGLKGLDGKRSGLWKEMHRVIQEAEPDYVLAENVAALRRRGLNVVLSDLADLGYDAEWGTIPASAVGAYHKRQRLFIIAYHQSLGVEGLWPARFEVPHRLAEALILDGGGDRKWQVEPDLRRVPDGIPNWMDRLRALGNAVVPQQVYPLLVAIMGHITTGTNTAHQLRMGI